MPTNPYTVTPAGDFGSGLHGLASSVRNLSEQRAKQRAQEKFEKMKMGALAAYRSGDPDKIAEFMINNPEMAKALEVSYSFKNDETRKNYLSSAYKILEAHEKSKGTKAVPSTPSAPITASVPTGPIEAAGEYPYDPSVLGLKEPPGTPFRDAEGNPMADPGVLTPEMSSVVKERKALLTDSGATPEQTSHTDAFEASYTKNPDATIRKIEHDIASMDPKGWKAWKEIYRPEGSKSGSSPLKKLISERQALLDKGASKDDPEVKAYDDKIWPKEDDDKDVAPSNIMKMYRERAELLASGTDPKSDIIRGLDSRILGDAVEKGYSPSPLKKLIKERKDLDLDNGADPDGPIIKAYDNKIAGIDLDVEDLTPEQYRFWGIWSYITGKMPSVGRGKMATKVRMGILKAGSDYALEVARDELRARGVKVGTNADPAVAAFNAVSTSTDTATIKGALGYLEKQEASMGSYVDNIDKQLNEFKELSKELFTFDARLMNIPLRFLRGKIAGSALQNKWDMFLMDISRETTKLAMGASQSIAPPSVEEIKNWDRVHDPNLTVEDIIDVLEKSKDAAFIRYKSVSDQLDRSRTRMKTRDYEGTRLEEDKKDLPTVSSQEQFDALESGDVYINQSTGKPMRKP